MSAIEYSKPQDALIVRDGVLIKGGVAVPNALVVSGRIEGDVSARKLLIAKTGVIKGKIVVEENAEIFGRVSESLVVKGLPVLRATCHVEGTVNYGILQIEQGARLTGEILSLNSQSDLEPVKGGESDGQDRGWTRIMRGLNHPQEPDSTVLDFPTKSIATPSRSSGVESSQSLSELLTSYLANRPVKAAQSPLKAK
jgi:cytoskeletal protein CcmA (bactofilin family)